MVVVVNEGLGFTRDNARKTSRDLTLTAPGSLLVLTNLVLVHTVHNKSDQDVNPDMVCALK